MSATKTGLVLDFGGPILLTPFELASRAERRLGLPAGGLRLTGPFDPAGDPSWQDVLTGRLGERQYWADRAADFAALTGRPGGVRELIGAIYRDESEAVMVRPGASALMADARASGIPVGILTNDLGAFHSQEWIDSLSVIRLADVLVDGSQAGILKPDPRIYLMMTDKLGVEPADAVFLDDQPVNLAGAAAVGLTAIPVDVTAPEKAFARARELLGLAAAATG
ncbi:MAG TPA: HAD-IA family hydrolase [Streptosporangiaceae bacterium]